MVIGGSIPTVEYGSHVWDAPERLAGAWSGEKPAFPTATQWVAHPVSSKQMRIVESSRVHRSFEVLNTSDVHRCSQMFKWVWRTSNPGHFLPFLFAPCLPNKCLVNGGNVSGNIEQDWGWSDCMVEQISFPALDEQICWTICWGRLGCTGMYWVTMVFSRSSPKESIECLDSPVEWQRWWYFNEEDITRVFSNLLGTRHGWHQPQAVHKHRAVRGICPKDVHLSDLFQFSNQLKIVFFTFVYWIPTNGMVLRHLTFTCLKEMEEELHLKTIKQWHWCNATTSSYLQLMVNQNVLLIHIVYISCVQYHN